MGSAFLRFVHEALGSLAAPTVRDTVIGAALKMAIPEERPTTPAGFERFVRGPLRAAMLDAFGVEVTDSVSVELEHVVMLALDHVLRRTRIGKAVRAVAANPQAAALMGINVGAIVVLAFVTSSGLAGVAGLLIAPITTASVFMGLTIALKAFSSAIVGGLTNPRGCIAGGFLLGVIEALVGLWRAELREITIFVLIIAVLVIKPEGLFGQKPFEKV